MYLLFTTSDLPVSRWIRSITGESVSHCAIQYGDCIMESSFLGVRLRSISDFLRHNRILYCLQIPDNPSRFVDVFEKYQGAGYDFGALLFLFLRYKFPRFISKRNLWQCTGMLMCTEFITTYLFDAEDSLITPYKLYLRLAAEKENLNE